jgi:hypothetical protein
MSAAPQARTLPQVLRQPQYYPAGWGGGIARKWGMYATVKITHPPKTERVLRVVQRF